MIIVFWGIAKISDNAAKLLNVATGKYLGVFEHNDNIYSAVFSQDGTRIVTASKDKINRLWNATNGECLLTTFNRTDLTNSAVFSADGKFIVTASWDNAARLWYAANGECMNTFYCPLRSAEFCYNGTDIITVSSCGDDAIIWDMLGEKLPRSFNGPRRVDSAIYSARDGRLITTVLKNENKLMNAGITLKERLNCLSALVPSQDNNQKIQPSLNNVDNTSSSINKLLLFGLGAFAGWLAYKTFIKN